MHIRVIIKLMTPSSMVILKNFELLKNINIYTYKTKRSFEWAPLIVKNWLTIAWQNPLCQKLPVYCMKKSTLSKTGWLLHEKISLTKTRHWICIRVVQNQLWKWVQQLFMMIFGHPPPFSNTSFPVSNSQTYFSDHLN